MYLRHNTYVPLHDHEILKWSVYCADVALTLVNQGNSADLPYCLVDLPEEIKYEKNDGENFTNQADNIGGVSVLCDIILSWAINQRIGQYKQENNVQ